MLFSCRRGVSFSLIPFLEVYTCTSSKRGHLLFRAAAAESIILSKLCRKVTSMGWMETGDWREGKVHKSLTQSVENPPFEAAAAVLSPGRRVEKWPCQGMGMKQT